MKRSNKEFEKACFGMPPEIGRCPTKIGTHPHKQKKFQNMAVGASRCCRGVWLRVNRLRPSWRWTRTTPRWKGRRGLWTALPVMTIWQRTTTRQFGQHRQLRTSRPVQRDHPSSSTTPASELHTSPGFNNFADHLTSHEPMLRQPHRTSRCTNSISTTTDNNIFWDSDTHVYFDSFHQSQ